MIRLEMKNLQYDISIKAAKISALSSCKMDKYEYLTGIEILASNKRAVIEKVQLCSQLLKNKQKKKEKMEDQGEKQIKVTEGQRKQLFESNTFVRSLIMMAKQITNDI